MQYPPLPAESVLASPYTHGESRSTAAPAMLPAGISASYLSAPCLVGPRRRQGWAAGVIGRVPRSLTAAPPAQLGTSSRNRPLPLQNRRSRLARRPGDEKSYYEEMWEISIAAC